MPVVPVGAIVAHRQLGEVPASRGSHHGCQGPGDSGLVLPHEGALGIIPRYFNRVPAAVISIAVEIVVDIVVASNTVDQGLFAESSRA